MAMTNVRTIAVQRRGTATRTKRLPAWAIPTALVMLVLLALALFGVLLLRDINDQLAASPRAGQQAAISAQLQGMNQQLADNALLIQGMREELRQVSSGLASNSPVLGQVQSSVQDTSPMLRRIEQRLEAMDQRLGRMDQSTRNLNERLDRIEQSIRDLQPASISPQGMALGVPETTMLMTLAGTALVVLASWAFKRRRSTTQRCGEIGGDYVVR